MAIVSNLVVKVTADKANFDRGIAGVNSTVRKVEGSALKATSAVNKLALAFVAVGAAGAIKSTINSFADFEHGLVGVSKTTGIVGSELANIGQEIRELTRTLPVASSELLEIAQSAGQLGVTGAANILRFTETVGKLGLASDLAGADAATSLARILTVTGTAISDVDRLGSTIVRLGNNFAATEAEIASVATRVAQSTAQFDVSAAQVLGISTALKAVGIEAESGGTQVGLAFQKINDAIRNGGKEMELLQSVTGRTGDSLRKDFFNGKSAVVFQSFINGLGEIQSSGGDVSKVLKGMGLNGVRAVQVLATLATRTDVLADALSQANNEWEANLALSREAAIASESFSSQLEIVKNAADEAASAIGSIIAPAALTGLSSFRDASISVTENLDAIKDVGQIVALLIGSRLVGSFTVLTVSTIKNTAATLTAVPASTGLSAAMGVQAASVTRSTIAMNASIIAATRLRVAYALIGGPVGLAVLAAGAIALYASKSDVATVSIEQMSIRLKELKGDFEGVQLATLEGSLTSIQSTIRTLREEIEKTSQSSLTTGGLGGETEKIKEYTAKLDLAKQTQLQLLENIAKLNTKPKGDGIDGSKGGKSPAATAIEETKTEVEKLKAVIEGLESNSAWQSLFGTAKTEVRSAQFDQYAKLVKANIESGDSFTQSNLKTLKNILQVSKNNAGTAFSTQGKFEKVDIAGMTSVVAGLEALIKDRVAVAGDTERADVSNQISELVGKNSETVNRLLELQQAIPQNSDRINKLLELQQSAPTTKVELKIVTPKGEIVEVVLASPKFAEAVSSIQMQDINDTAKAGE